jgi:tRNA(fMet)-specific endonuclease VapC
MTTRYLLDTNTVSYVLKGTYPAVRKRIAVMPAAALCISAVTQSELIYGVALRPQATRLAAVVTEFLRWVDVADWSADVAQTHGGLRADLRRRGVGVETFDLMIAAHALTLSAVLVSHDTVFRMIHGLKIEDWTQNHT